MTELVWSELHPPRDLKLDDVTALVRVLAGRPRFGILQTQPITVFELWITADRMRWLVGCDERIARHLPGELTAQVPGLSSTSLKSSPRKSPITARGVRVSGVAYPLRLDIGGAVAAGLLQAHRRLGRQEAVVIQWHVGPSQRLSRRPEGSTPLQRLGLTQPRKIEFGEKAAWKIKTSEPLFGVRGRVGAVAADPKRADQLIGPVISALGLAVSARTRVVASRQSNRRARQLFQAANRFRSWSSLVNAAELAVMLGLPIDGVAAPGDNSLDLAAAPRSLLVPADKPEHAKGDRLIGVSVHPRDEGALVRLPLKSSFSNIHLISPIGGGKSTVCASWVLSEVEAGRSVFVLEPKNDLVVDIVSRLPEEFHQNLVMLGSSRNDQPVVGLNPLAGPKEDAERRADSMLGLFKAVFGSAIGPRSADLLLHSLTMAARLDDGCLTDVPAILTNPAFRRRVLARVSDPLIIAPWAAGFDSLSDQERVRVVMPVLNKTRALTNRTLIRQMLSQAKPRFSLDELFTSPKIVLCSLNAGILGPVTTKLVGSIVLGQFWEAIQRQAGVPEADRRPVSAVIDELPEFTGALDFAEVLSRSRGMRVSFTLAHQHMSQLNPNLRAALYANARSRISWRPAKDDVKPLADVFGVQAAVLAKLPAYHAVVQVLVDNTPSAPFAVKTLRLTEPINDPDALRAASAQRYGVDPNQLDAALVERWRGGEQPPEGLVGMRRRLS